MINLNPFIFSQIAYYLVIDNSFNNVLELSLLSKSSFKLFQNIISDYNYNNNNNNNKFILELDQLINYIKNSKNSNNSYNFKLIQYKDIELIKIDKIKYNTTIYYYEILKLNCNKLKNVILLDTIDYFKTIGKYGHIYEDGYCCNGFFIINSLKLIWTKKDIPFSIDDNLSILNNDYDDDNESYKFSFLLKLNPIELIIGTCQPNSNKDTLYLSNLENILNCKSIKSIKFENHFITNEFLNLILNNQADIKSLKLVAINTDGLTDLVHSLLKAGIETNSTLNKLEIEYIQKYSSGSSSESADFVVNSNFNILINLLSSNKSINTFGFYGDFKITDNDCLKSLIGSSNNNINTICIGIGSAELVINHCKYNNKINEIKFNNIYDVKGQVTYQEYFKNQYFSSVNDFQLLKLSSNSMLMKILNRNGIKPTIK